jgi:Uma2 family endonuclease
MAVIPFPMPPSLNRLHQILERYTETHEEGFFMAEQDRNQQFRAQPVLVFVGPESLKQDPKKAPKRQAPDWIGEILGDKPYPERMARYAKAGVREYWRIDLGLNADGIAPARIEVHVSPNPDGTFSECTVFTDDQQVESDRFPGLELCPQDLR